MYSQISANKRKTVLIIVGFLLLVAGLGWLFSQIQGTPAAFSGVLIFALIYAIFSYFASARIALALSGARRVSKKDAPELYRVIENLTIAAGLPMPSVHIINDPAPNAFATGRDPQHAAVAVTTGLLEILDKEELEGVIAHELSHVGNYDIRVMGIVLGLVTIIALVSDFFLRMSFWGFGDDDDSGGNGLLFVVGIVAALLAPLVATLLQLAVSRKREFLADASGVLITRYPEGLASALTKIGNSKQDMRHATSATAHLFIANPFRGKRGRSFLAGLFSTHPPIEERVKRLIDMGDEL